VEIKVALIGVGNCASSLVQGVSYYHNTNTTSGLIIPEICGFKPKDIKFVSAFDVDKNKTGKILKDAIFEGQNNTLKLTDEIFNANCSVSPAPILDGISELYKGMIDIEDDVFYKVDDILKKSKPDILINYLPVGSDEATKFWAQKCLEHHIGFINAIPSFIVSRPEWSSKFEKAGLPCAGDDVKSQVGATIIHRTLARLFKTRGTQVENSYQLNFGGNMDFYNMLESGRLATKKESKISSVKHEVPELEEKNLHISPTDYISYLQDQKIAYINITGRGFANVPIEIECKLKVVDSPNSAGVIIDVIRFMAAAKFQGFAGPLPVSSFYFKSPPDNIPDFEAEKIARELALESCNIE
jgi:myo-inositol-1-phosphate synthase